MASTIPDSMTFQMLRRLPPQSFVIQWRKYRPNQAIPAGGVDITSTKYETNTTIQGTVNEVALMSKAKVVVSVSGKQDLNCSTANGDITAASNSPVNRDSPFNAPSWKYAMANLITQSRESFNAQSLYVMENTDDVAHAPINVLRGLCARRVASIDAELQGNTDDFQLNQLTINELESAGFSGCKQRSQGVGFNKTGANTLKVQGVPAVGSYNFSRDCVKTYEVPLGFYSSMANTYSVIPLGLLSTFSVNGWNQQLTFGNGGKSAIFPTFSGTAGEPNALTGGTTIAYENTEVKLYNVEIHVPIVQILNPEIMNGLLSLYRKQGFVDIGNISVPMSLRLNNISFDTRSFPLDTTNAVQNFVVPTTEKSVRALGWIIYDSLSANRDATTLPNNLATTRLNEDSSSLLYPLCVKGITLKKLYIRAGRDDLMPCVENNNPNSGEVEGFVYQNLKEAAAVFSPFPYWAELVNKNVAGAEDVLHNARAKSVIGQGAEDSNITNRYNYRSRSNCSVQYGCVSFQNTDYRNAESGQVASGISLNNIGRFDVEMDFRSIVDGGNGALSYTDAQLANKRIVFLIAYDSVLECSANQGVQEITNAVMI